MPPQKSLYDIRKMADSGMRPDEVYETTPKIPLRLLKDSKYNLINIVKCNNNLG